MWWLNWNTFGALLACIAVVAVPIIFRRFLQQRQAAKTEDQLALATECESCGSQSAPLGALDFFGFEGWFISSWNRVHYCTAVCEKCATEIVAHSRRRATKTWWRCLQGPWVLLLTFTNGRTALKQHAASLK